MSNLYIFVLMCLSATSQAVPQKRFSGGTDVITNDFPWVGSLQQNISGVWTHICGMVAGTNVGVTAAQCYPQSAMSSDYRLVFDANDLSVLAGATITAISSVLRDAGFSANGPGFRNDNVELRTDHPVSVNGLPFIGLAVDHAGLQCDIFGWETLENGTFIPILQQRNVTLISRADCQARVSSLGANITATDTCVEGDVISEGDIGNPIRCNGDIVGGCIMDNGRQLSRC